MGEDVQMKMKKGYFGMIKTMKPMDELEDDEKDTVGVSCITGVAIGLLIGMCSAIVPIVIIYGVITQ
jgi:hypothetical protein